eukprot:3559175-Amphidinium_carterae.1
MVALLVRLSRTVCVVREWHVVCVSPASFWSMCVLLEVVEVVEVVKVDVEVDVDVDGEVDVVQSHSGTRTAHRCASWNQLSICGGLLLLSKREISSAN